MGERQLEGSRKPAELRGEGRGRKSHASGNHSA